jgi:hypothetical protein
MENKILFFGILFIAAFLVLGCTGAQKEQKAETPAVTAPAAQQPAVPVAPVEEEAPVYIAPLTGKITKNCKENSDCILVKYKTGTGVTEECMSATSDYKGASTDTCYCKNIGSQTQTFINGTEVVVQTYECRHV